MERKRIKFTGRKTFELITKFHKLTNTVIKENKTPLDNDTFIQLVSEEFTKDELSAIVFGLDIAHKDAIMKLHRKEVDLKTDMAFQ